MSRMAKAVLGIIVLSSALVPVAVAQTGVQYTPGVMAGANFATLSVDPTPPGLTFDRATGLVTGVFVGMRFNDNVSLEPELLFSVKGAKVVGTGSAASESETVRLTYLDAPLLAKFWISASNNQVRPFLFAGPDIAYMLTCTTQGSSCAVNAFKPKHWDIGATFGGGFEVPINKQVIRLDARYTLGFSNIHDTSDGDNATIKNRVFALTAGWGYPLPR